MQTTISTWQTTVINLTTNIILINPELPTLRSAVEWTAHQCMPKAEIGNSLNKQARYRYALHVLLEQDSSRMHSASNIYEMFQLTNTDKYLREQRCQIYKKLIGARPRFDEDVVGLQTPFRAIFLQLWHAGEVLLPYDFSFAGVNQKYPELYKKTSFATDLTIGAKAHVYESMNNFKYMTNWHSARDVCFDELWSVAPEICELQSKLRTDTTLRTRFSYLTWLCCR
ncbi:hypothetical protein V0M98_24650 [Pseudomonas silesiensis]|uniref:hypothetical protein n=1 Tax=Pseudomonas silesiensis TaxID=1853130 RepID=UPI0030CF64E6